jgi:chromosome segregation ATPase
MKKIAYSFFVLAFLFCLWGIPSFAADPSEEIEQLKGEVNRLLQKIEDLEKRQTETEMKAREAEKKAMEVEKKTGETEKRFAEVEAKTEKVEKKLPKVDLSAQIRAFYLNRDKDETHDYRNNYFEVYKFRVAAKGEVSKLIQFYGMIDANENEDYSVKLWEGDFKFVFVL